MSLILKNIEKKGGGMLDLSYIVTHHTPGPSGTMLELPVVVRLEPGMPFSLSMDIKDCKGASPDEALDKLVLWLRRAAEAIESRPPSVAIPLNARSL
jgi:hypothetical protein